MRVGIVCPYSFDRHGGVQNHVLGLAGWLKQQGHHVEILAPGEPPAGMLADYGLDRSQYTTGGKAVPVKANGSVVRLRPSASQLVSWPANEPATYSSPAGSWSPMAKPVRASGEFSVSV